MNSFFQLFFAWGLLLVFILVLYIIDKVNVIYQSYAKPDLPQTYNDGLFGELSGKSLWDAMSGIPVPGVDAKFVARSNRITNPCCANTSNKCSWKATSTARLARQACQPTTA